MRKKKTPIKTIQPARIATHKGKPAFILAADDHVRNGAPECRMDDYVEAIFKKLEFRNDVALEYNIPILHAGDLGDKSYFVKEGNGWTADIYNRYILAMEYISLYVSAGNHDLLGHDYNNLHKSALGGLIESDVINDLVNLNNYPNLFEPGAGGGYVDGGSGSKWMDDIDICVYGCAWDQEIPKISKSFRNILVIHKMIINQLPLWPGQEAPKAQDILKQNPDYDLIVSGDNHNTFTAEYNGRLLVNPGSMMRSTTKQFDHKPCFFLYYPESNTVEKIFYPIDDPETTISLKHIENKAKNNERTEKYTTLVNKADLTDLKTFKENSEIFISKAGAAISDIVTKLIRGFVNHEEPEKP